MDRKSIVIKVFSRINKKMRSSKDLARLKSKIIRVAQKVYDAWSGEDDWQVGNGGICHLIADEITSILDKNGIESTTVSSDHEVHVWVAAKLEDGTFLVDIPYSTYETGGGYNWKKRPNIVFTESDVIVEKLSADPEHFNKEYLEN